MLQMLYAGIARYGAVGIRAQETLLRMTQIEQRGNNFGDGDWIEIGTMGTPLERNMTLPTAVKRIEMVDCDLQKAPIWKFQPVQTESSIFQSRLSLVCILLQCTKSNLD